MAKTMLMGIPRMLEIVGEMKAEVRSEKNRRRRKALDERATLMEYLMCLHEGTFHVLLYQKKIRELMGFKP